MNCIQASQDMLTCKAYIDCRTIAVTYNGNGDAGYWLDQWSVIIHSHTLKRSDISSPHWVTDYQ